VYCHKVASLQRCAVPVDSAVQPRQRIRVDRLRRTPRRTPCHVSHRTAATEARVKWPYFNWAPRSCDRLPLPILAHCILVQHGAPDHVTRDHHSGVNGDGQTCGTDRDHLGPARACRKPTIQWCGRQFCSCSLCDRHCRGSPMPGALIAGVGRGACSHTCGHSCLRRAKYQVRVNRDHYEKGRDVK